MTNSRPDLSAIRRPDLKQMQAIDTTPEPDPLAGVPLNLGHEAHVQAETSALLAAFKAREQREDERFQLAVDSEFWVALCFQSREQKERFLEAMQWLADGDKYLDGPAIARKLGIGLPAVQLPKQRRTPDRTLAHLVKPDMK